MQSKTFISLILCMFSSIVVCPALQNPENGYVDYSNQQRAIGTIATYSCKSVYVTTGNEERQCQIDATWSGSAPTCTSEYTIDVC